MNKRRRKLSRPARRRAPETTGPSHCQRRWRPGRPQICADVRRSLTLWTLAVVSSHLRPINYAACVWRAPTLASAAPLQFMGRPGWGRRAALRTTTRRGAGVPPMSAPMSVPMSESVVIRRESIGPTPDLDRSFAPKNFKPRSSGNLCRVNTTHSRIPLHNHSNCGENPANLRTKIPAVDMVTVYQRGPRNNRRLSGLTD